MSIDFSRVVNKDTVKAEDERQWRNAELARADIQLMKAEDGMKGIGTQKAWRAYRVELREWPASETFPNVRPVAPDAEV